jgi:hypothetical protein
MEQSRTRNEEMPNRAFDRDPAEGSRDSDMNRERGSERSGGISNRPLDDEQDEQDRLPERDRSPSES